MNSQNMHNPWRSGGTSDGRSSRSAMGVNTRQRTFDATSVNAAGRQVFSFLSVGVDKCRIIAPRLREFAMRWTDRMRAHWRSGRRTGKFVAVLYAAGGLILLAVFAYLIVILLPLVLFGVFITAILTSMGTR